MSRFQTASSRDEQVPWSRGSRRPPGPTACRGGAGGPGAPLLGEGWFWNLLSTGYRGARKGPADTALPSQPCAPFRG